MVCGGGYYDRDVYSVDDYSSTSNTTSRSNTTSSSSYSSSSPTYGYSNQSQNVFSKTVTLDKLLEPTRFKNSKLVSKRKNPIVLVLDVTSSMGGYLDDPVLSFCGCGDAFADDAPLQISNFGQGKVVDQMISKMYLEGGGGGQHFETYELAAYFYSTKLDISQSKDSFCFFTGDELFYDSVSSDHIKEYIGENKNDVPSKTAFANLKKKFNGNVFLLKKPYWNAKTDKEILAGWQSVLGKENVIIFQTPKAVVDIVLGIIAIVSGKRNLENYISDMKNRGQDAERIKEVRKALYDVSTKYGTGYTDSFSQPKKDIIIGSVEEDDMQQQSSIKESHEKFKDLVLSLEYQKDKQEEEIVLLRKELTLLKQLRKNSFPEEFCCPITFEPLVDPVITEDGHTYERVAITEWFKKNNTSPLTNKVLSSKKLRPNHLLRKFIMEFCEKNKNPL